MTEHRRVVTDDPTLSPDVVRDVRAALEALARDGDAGVLDPSLRAACVDARRLGLSPEQVVVSLKQVWRGSRPPGIVGAMDWDIVYRVALTRALAIFFELPRP